MPRSFIWKHVSRLVRFILDSYFDFHYFVSVFSVPVFSSFSLGCHGFTVLICFLGYGLCSSPVSSLVDRYPMHLGDVFIALFSTKYGKLFMCFLDIHLHHNCGLGA